MIPVLVAGAGMPAVADLPPTLAPLARRQAVELRPVSFAADINELMAHLRKARRNRADALARRRVRRPLRRGPGTERELALPAELRDGVSSPHVRRRRAALAGLRELLNDQDPERRRAAEEGLLLLVQDPDRTIAREAFQIRQRHLYGGVRSVGEILAARVAEPGVGTIPAGIDFGTTNSAVGVWASEYTITPSSTGEETTPSILAATPADEWLVGRAAKPKGLVAPSSTVRSVKLHLGTDWRHEVYGRAYTAVEVAAIILSDLKATTEAYWGEPLGRVVITVPANFDLGQREATVRAAELAGLEVVRMVNEPTAAALAYGVNKPDKEVTVLIFDLGGGTLDVSLLEIGEGVAEVKATAGDNALGGDDWDNRLADHLMARFSETHGIDVSDDPVAVERVREAAERAKIELSTALSTEISVPYLARDADDDMLDLDVTLTRAEFTALTSDLLLRCRGPVERAIKDAWYPSATIDEILLVGGSTRMPAIADLLHELTGKRPRRDVLADGVVRGAAILAATLTGRLQDVLLLDVTPMSLGIETRGGIMTKIIERNTSIPTKRTEIFTTAEDDQAVILVQVFQGDREIASHNRKLGAFELALPPAPRHVPQIEISVAVDANGIVEVSAKDVGTGTSESLRITQESIDAAARPSGDGRPATTLPANLPAPPAPEYPGPPRPPGQATTPDRN